MYVYIQSSPKSYTVGHYTPAGIFLPESDYGVKENAVDRVSFLNGGSRPTWDVERYEHDLKARILELEGALADLRVLYAGRAEEINALEKRLEERGAPPGIYTEARKLAIAANLINAMQHAGNEIHPDIWSELSAQANLVLAMIKEAEAPKT